MTERINENKRKRKEWKERKGRNIILEYENQKKENKINDWKCWNKIVRENNQKKGRNWTKIGIWKRRQKGTREKNPIVGKYLVPQVASLSFLRIL